MKNMKSICIEAWHPVPSEMNAARCEVRFVVRTADLRWGLLEISLPDAFGESADWCRLTLIGRDNDACTRLKESEFPMPESLRDEIMRRAIEHGVDSIQGFLVRNPPEPSVGRLAFWARAAKLANDPQSLTEVERTIKQMPTFDADDPDDAELANYFKRLAKALRRSPKTKVTKNGGNP